MYISCHVLYADLCKFSRVSFSPFTGDVLKEKKTNVPTSRVFTCSGVEFKWANILSKLQNMCQNVLLCPYVCKTSLSEVHIYSHTQNYIIILCIHVQCMHACLLLRKSVIYKWENQLLSRQIEVIKWHFLNDHLMKIAFPIFRFACSSIY